jgi:hypothetical protein
MVDETPITSNNSDQQKKCEYCSQIGHSPNTCTANLEKDVICKQCNVPAGRALMTYNEYHNWLCANCLHSKNAKSNVKDDSSRVDCDCCHNVNLNNKSTSQITLECKICKDCHASTKDKFMTNGRYFPLFHNWTCDKCLSAKNNTDIKVNANEIDNHIKTTELSDISIQTNPVEASQGYRPGVDCRFCKSSGHMIHTCPVDTLTTHISCYNCRYPTHTTITKDQIDNWLCYKCDNLEWSMVNSMPMSLRGLNDVSECRFCYRNHTYESCTAIVIKNVMCRYCPKYGISNLEKRIVTKEQLINYVCDSCASIEKITIPRYFVTDDSDGSLRPYTGDDSITVQPLTQKPTSVLSSSSELKQLKDRLAVINAIISKELIFIDMTDGTMTNVPASVIEETLKAMGFSIELYRSLKCEDLTPKGIFQLQSQIARLEGTSMYIQIPDSTINQTKDTTPSINQGPDTTPDSSTDPKSASAIDKELAAKELATKELATKELATKELATKELATKELATKELATKELAHVALKISKCEFCFQDGHTADNCTSKARKQVKCRCCQYSRIEMVTISQTNDWTCNNCTRYVEFFQGLDAFPDQLANQEDDDEMDISLDKNVPYLHIQYLDTHGFINSKMIKMPDCFDHWDFNKYGMIPECSYILKTLPYPNASIRVLFQMPIRLFNRK